MCSYLHAPSRAADCGPTLSPPPPAPRARIDPADLVAVELHTRTERRRIQCSAQESASAILAADESLAQMTLYLRHCPGIDVATRSLIAEHVRTAMVAHHAALLRVTEIESIARRMGVA